MVWSEKGTGHGESTYDWFTVHLKRTRLCNMSSTRKRESKGWGSRLPSNFGWDTGHYGECVEGSYSQQADTKGQKFKGCIYMEWNSVQTCPGCWCELDPNFSHTPSFSLNAHFLLSAANTEVTVQFNTEHGLWWQKWEDEEKNLRRTWSFASIHACAQILESGCA